MRRLFVILAGIAVVPTGLACQHTAGKCDCQPPLAHCTKYGLYTPEVAADHIPRQDMLPPPGTPKMIPAGTSASDVGDPVRISPSAGVSGFGD